MTREEWVIRAALRYQVVGGALDEDMAREAAESLYDSDEDVPSQVPEDAADEDISNWENDE